METDDERNWSHKIGKKRVRQTIIKSRWKGKKKNSIIKAHLRTSSWELDSNESRERVREENILYWNISNTIWNSKYVYVSQCILHEMVGINLSPPFVETTPYLDHIHPADDISLLCSIPLSISKSEQIPIMFVISLLIGRRLFNIHPIYLGIGK